jgi:hypothetical protein
MLNRSFLIAALLLALATLVRAGEPIASATKLAFGNANTLFVADWRGARIHALSLPAPAPALGEPFNLKDVQSPIARALHVDRSRLRFEDMVVQPGAELAYVALTLRQAAGPGIPALVSIDARGRVKVIDLHKTSHRSVAISDSPSAELKLWRTLPAQSLTVTGMTVYGNKLYVAGLSNRSFASTLRIYDLPFNGTSTATTVEMYHPVHDQIETRAPIRTMTILDIAGTPTMVAAYTCTPLVAIPLADLKDGAHVAGKTIGEMGWGSEPVDLIAFNTAGADYLLLLNSSRSADLIPVAAIAESVKQPGLSQPIKWPAEPLAGVRAVSIPMAATSQLDNLNKELLLAMRREEASGEMQLVTIPKGAYLRVSDFVDEYDFPDFQYSAKDTFHEYHKYFHRIEGYPELVR